MREVKITKYWRDKCMKFATEVVDTNKALYLYRGAGSVSKIIEDIYIGKLGEVGVYKHIKDMGSECTKPDFEIYSKKRKSYDADLFINEDKCVHVKSQSAESALKYGHSWLFQRTDPVYVKPNNDYFYGTMVDDTVVYIVKETRIRYLKFKPCKLKWFNKTKVAVYA